MLFDWSAETLTLNDLRRIRQAIRRGWNVPADVRKAIIAAIGQLIKDPQSSTRMVLSIGKMAVLAVASDLEASRKCGR